MSKIREALEKAKRARQTDTPDESADLTLGRIKVSQRMLEEHARGEREREQARESDRVQHYKYRRDSGRDPQRRSEGDDTDTFAALDSQSWAEQLEARHHVHLDHEGLRRAGLMAPETHERRLAEEYRQIKRPLLVNAGNRDAATRLQNARLIMVTSAMSGEGKTFTCINLALSIAREKDWRVVLVDGDVAKPHITQLFGFTDEPGLLDLLRDPSLSVKECIVPTDVPGLAILPAGRQDTEATELLASQRMVSLAKQLGRELPGTIVLFDSPPLLLTTEAGSLAVHAGQIVVVVRAQHTTHEQVGRAVSALDQDKAVSLILNQVESGQESLGYGYGASYGAGYGYGFGSQPREGQGHAGHGQAGQGDDSAPQDAR